MIGFAFGHPLHSDAMRGHASKRRATSGASVQIDQSPNLWPTTPSPHAISAPISSFNTRETLRKPLTAAAKKTPESRYEDLIHYNGRPLPGSAPGLNSKANSEPAHNRGRRSFQFDFRTVENTRPSNPRPTSTMSWLWTGSPGLTSPPGSASLSQSNSSTAAILPASGSLNARLPSRNRLVKRSSSHKALDGSTPLHSTLRRPATSYQRSATLHRHYHDGVDDATPISQTTTMQGDRDHEKREANEDACQYWRPFFKSQPSRVSKIGSSAKRKISGPSIGNEGLPTVVPDLTELPTLLLATSIGSSSSDPTPLRRTSDISQLARPFTPSGITMARSSPLESGEPQSNSETGPKSRNSLSFSEVFPSPSPLTWRMPRAGSLRSKRLLTRRLGSRRITSAPNPSQQEHQKPEKGDDRMLGNHTRIYATAAPDVTPSKPPKRRQHSGQRHSSSPLPPLNRLSSFKLNLPETIPSYPTTPGRRESLPRSRKRSLSSSSISKRNQSSRQGPILHSPTAHSEHASTLLGSDAEISQLLSDKDDLDGRSSTFYDSTRTGATLNSNASRKTPHIDALFSDSILPELQHSRPGDAEEMAFAKLSLDDEAGEPPTLAIRNEFANPSLTKTESDNLPSGNQTRFESPPRRGCDTPSIWSAPGPEYEGAQRTLDWLREKPLPDAPGTDPDYPDSQQVGVNSNSRGNVAQEEQRSRKSTPRRRESPPTSAGRLNPFEWSEQSNVERDTSRPKTVQGREAQDLRLHRLNSRRGPPPLHLRSQSVPVPSDNRPHSTTAKLDSWTLGKHGASEDWDGDFDFDDSSLVSKPVDGGLRPNLSSGMLVPKSILENQASVHGQFGQVKELTKLVEELRRLQHQARVQGIMEGQAAELWKEAEGIINLATIDDDEHSLLPAHSPSTEFDPFDEDSPSNRRRRSELTPPRDGRSQFDQAPLAHMPPGPLHEPSGMQTPPSGSRSRKESAAKAKSVLEHVHHPRKKYDPALLDAKLSQRKLPFDTTSLKDLVTRAGVVTRALKEEVRRAEKRSESPDRRAESRQEHFQAIPPDPPFSQMFQKPPSQPSTKKPSPHLPGKGSRIAQSPKSPRSPKSSRSSILGGSISGNENDINGHMKVMTVV